MKLCETIEACACALSMWLTPRNCGEYLKRYQIYLGVEDEKLARRLLHNLVASIAAVQTKKINLTPDKNYLKPDDLFSFSITGLFSWWLDTPRPPCFSCRV